MFHMLIQAELRALGCFTIDAVNLNLTIKILKDNYGLQKNRKKVAEKMEPAETI